MKNLPLAIAVSIGLLLMSAGILANLSGDRAELRGSWLAKLGR